MCGEGSMTGLSRFRCAPSCLSPQGLGTIGIVIVPVACFAGAAAFHLALLPGFFRV